MPFRLPKRVLQMVSLYRRVWQDYTISFWVNRPVFRALLNVVTDVKQRACVRGVWIFGHFTENSVTILSRWDIWSAAIALTLAKIFLWMKVLMLCDFLVSNSDWFFLWVLIFVFFRQNLLTGTENGHITICLASCDLEGSSFEGRRRSKYNLVWVSTTFW